MSSAEYEASLMRQLADLDRRIQDECSPIVQRALGPQWIAHIRDEIQRFFKGVDPDSDAPCFESELAIPFFFLSAGGTLQRFDDAVRAIDAASKRTSLLRKQVQRIAENERGNVLGSLFEVFVVGEIAKRNRLISIGVCPSPTARSNVDARIRIGQREAYLEATLITKGLAPPTSTFGWLSVDEMMAQVSRKLQKKGESGKQLDLSTIPAILVIGLSSRGADRITAEWAIQDRFKKNKATQISAAAVAGSWEMRGADIYSNPNAVYPLTSEELSEFETMMNPQLPPDYDPEGIRIANEILKRLLGGSRVVS